MESALRREREPTYCPGKSERRITMRHHHGFLFFP